MSKPTLKNILLILGLGIAGMFVTPMASAAVDVTHGRDCTTATTIPLATKVETAFSNSSDRAVYRFKLDARGLIDVMLSGGDSNVGQAELLDSSCQPLSLSGGLSMISGNASRITVPSPVWTLGPGLYFLRFSPATAVVKGAAFAFEVAFRPHFGHDCATAEPISSQGLSSISVNGELLYPEDRQVFRIVVNEPGQIRAWTTGPLEPPNQPYVDLLFADCSSGAEFQSYDSNGIVMTTSRLSPGTYYLAIVPEPHTLGSYTLEVEWLADLWWERILD